MCDKAGCDVEATYAVILHAADGSEMWKACRAHMLAFRAWMTSEAEQQGADWSAVLLEELPDPP